MTKLLGNRRYISLLSVLAMGLLVQPAWSQSQAPIPVSKPFDHAVESKVDYGLLVRAMRQFLAQDRYLLKSELTLKAKTPGANLVSVAHIQTISAEPNRFRTKVQFGQGGGEYLFVSDGQKVWTHDVAKNRYTIRTSQQFQKAHDNFLSGMLSRLFSTIRNSSETGNISQLMQVPEATLVKILKTTLATNPSGFKSDTKRLEGSEYTTFSYLDQAKGYQMQAFIDELTSEIKYLQISSHHPKRLRFQVREKVISYTNPPSVPADAFRFVPPKGAKLQQKPISINPFLQ